MQLWVENCPKCKIQNAVDLGDLNDCTGVDKTGMQCRECGFLIRPDGWEDWMADEGMDYIEDGEPLTNWIRQ